MTDAEFTALQDMARLRGLRVVVDGEMMVVSNDDVSAAIYENRAIASYDALDWAVRRLAAPFFGEQK